VAAVVAAQVLLVLMQVQVTLEKVATEQLHHIQVLQ
jgi:hypothetical protein